ncbi:MAG: hypothetical protein FRX48_08160 [Lasallia pustulata]|uniref:Uncharacterized protein n=1 Tax=Lasallia pustulata TaxID=136370 RepID=A0A5M8PEN1_9LECA|nr:MAG: hypothetical protein FRX48_08160 [Lasallia pustulata]
MGGNASSDHVTPNQLTVSRALDIARNREDGVSNPAVNEVLETAIGGIWRRISTQPAYVMTKEEFAVFNYYRNRFSDSHVAQQAVGRFWNHHQGDASAVDGTT